MIHPDKNVPIKRLFEWGKEFSIVSLFGKEKLSVYMRLVGDADIGASRTFALRKSGELRKKLRTEDTDERVAFITSVYEVESLDELIDLITNLKIREFAQDAYKEVKVPFPKEPRSDADLELQEKYQEALDAYDELRNSRINEYIFNRISELRSSLVNQTEDYLRKMYEKLMIHTLCEEEMIKKFREHCVYLGSYLDPEYTQRVFDKFEEFENLNKEVKEQFLASYSMLEIDMDGLKKSLEAMP